MNNSYADYLLKERRDSPAPVIEFYQTNYHRNSIVVFVENDKNDVSFFFRVH